MFYNFFVPNEFNWKHFVVLLSQSVPWCIWFNHQLTYALSFDVKLIYNKWRLIILISSKAVNYSGKDTVQVLLTNGADVTIKNIYGNTPLNEGKLISYSLIDGLNNLFVARRNSKSEILEIFE